MVRAKPKKKAELLSPSERANLEDEKRELETALAQSEEGYGAGTQGEQLDKSKLRGEIKRLDNAIEERTPGKIRAAAKDKLYAEEKELEETLSEGLPSWYEMRQPTKNPGAVRKHMAWCSRNLENIDRYREIQRILRPFDPKSIENLRKDK